MKNLVPKAKLTKREEYIEAEKLHNCLQKNKSLKSKGVKTREWLGSLLNLSGKTIQPHLNIINREKNFLEALENIKLNKEKISRSLDTNMFCDLIISDDFEKKITYKSFVMVKNKLALKEINLVFEDNVILNKDLNEHSHLVGLKKSFEIIIALVKGKVELSESTIKHIYLLLTIHEKIDFKVYGDELNTNDTVGNESILSISKINEVLNAYKNSDDDIATKITDFYFSFLEIGELNYIDKNVVILLINFCLISDGYPPIIAIKYKNASNYDYVVNDSWFYKDITIIRYVLAVYIDESLEQFKKIV